MNEPRTKAEWVGRRVRAREELRRGTLVVPKGAVLSVTGYRAGLRLLGDACACCGVRPVLRGVPEGLVELIHEAQHV